MKVRTLPNASFWALLAAMAGLAKAQPVAPQVAGPTLDAALEARPPKPCTLQAHAHYGGRSLWEPNLWSGGAVPYEFDANTTPSEQTAMRQAMDALEAAAYIHFVPRSGQGDYLHILNSTGNFTMGIGNYGGAQNVNIFNWNYRYIMCHELMHALGLEHEQCRSDRDQYVTINYANIQSGWSSQYDIQSGTPVGPFDFDSVMCYGECDASICCPADSTCSCAASCWTITALPAYAQSQGLMGQRTHLSSGDVSGLVSRYGAATCPVFGTQPQSTSFTVGQTATLTASATGAGTPTYRWRKGGVPLSDDGRITGSSTGALSIASATPSDSGQYDCVATNSCGSTPSNPATLSVNACPLSLAAPVSFGASANPISVAAADLDGDGKLDLVTANNSSPTVSVLLGNGDGTFRSAANYPAVSNPFAVAVADFNGDGKPDLAVANNDGVSSHNIAILLGVGDGSFLSPVSVNTGVFPVSLATADFNGDGKQDLAVATEGSNGASILLGNGNGTFQPAVNYNTGTNPISVAVADFNADGTPDLVVSNYSNNNVSILLGNGNGTFQPAVNYSAGPATSGAYSVAVGDFNADGRPDIAVTNIATNSVSILPNNGNGTFHPAASVGTVNTPWFVAVGDFNSDGRPDLAVTNRTGNSVVTLLGNGDGTFQPGVSCAVGSDPRCIAVADFNGDSRADLATANYNGNNVSVLRNTVPGLTVTQQPAPQTVPSATATSLSIAATGASSYQWRRNGVPLTDTNYMTGSLSPTLSFNPAIYSDTGSYDCIVANGCGSTTSSAATLIAYCTQWTQLAASGPSPRYAQACFDSVRNNAVLFGGYDGSAYDADTWTFDGALWSSRPVSGPAARAHFAIAFDTHRSVAVLFGGVGPSQAYGDTWEWNGNTWSHPLVSGPPARYGVSMCFDSTRNVMVLYGGLDGSSHCLGDLWEYDGSSWTQRTPQGPTPGLRSFQGMAYDTVRHVSVLFGGSTSSSGRPVFNDTWEWNGAAWSQRQPTGTLPPARAELGMVFDPDRSETIIFGGDSDPTGGHELGDSWAWNGTSWRLLAVNAPPPRVVHALWYDSHAHSIGMFGGTNPSGLLGDTWALSPELSVQSQTTSAVTCTGSTTVSLAAVGHGPFSYQWSIETAPGTWTLFNTTPITLPCGTARADTPYAPSTNITISPCAGQYQVRCIINNNCATAVSAPTAITVNSSDFNGDGDIGTDADIESFFACLAGNCCPTCGSADFNGDGDIGTDADIESFFRVLAGGSC